MDKRQEQKVRILRASLFFMSVSAVTLALLAVHGLL